MRRMIVGLAVSISVAVSASAQVPVDRINGFKVGQATKAEVLAGLGKPYSQNRATDGRTQLMYLYTVAPTSVNGNIDGVYVSFVFNPSGVLLGTMSVGHKASPSSETTSPPSTSSPEKLKDENILTPMPQGFKVGYDETQQGFGHILEIVPRDETVFNWTQMVTQQTLARLANADPDLLPSRMQDLWAKQCPGGTAQRLSRFSDNGYPAAIWSFLCPLNPATQKPETMWIKTISGSDSFYSIQYAYTRAFSQEMVSPTLDYLSKNIVCDPRSPAHPCPNLTPATK